MKLRKKGLRKKSVKVARNTTRKICKRGRSQRNKVKNKEGSSTFIVETDFERVTRKAQEKKEKVVLDLIRIKIKAHGDKALTKTKKEVKLSRRGKLLNKIEKIPLSTEKGNVKKTQIKELVENFDREMNELSPLDDAMVLP
uniref:Protein MNN4-like n=1 Tax=Cucumis melo TaxID=3656 RepID=A0A9I9CUS3_CUCME